MGNICRSPLAEGVLRKRLAEKRMDLTVQVDSAGTHSYHAGSPPDKRAQEAARRRGIDIAGLRARRVEASDFDRFDHILAMDSENLAALVAVADPAAHSKIRLFLEVAGRNAGAEVPDPYYGGAKGFERVLDLVEEAADRLLDELIIAGRRR